MLFGECTYTNKPVGMQQYQKLFAGSQLVPHKQAYYILFSKSGFEENLIELSKSLDNLELITLDTLISDIDRLSSGSLRRS